AVYTRDPAIPSQQRTQLADLLQTITQVRADPSLDFNARRDKLISLPNSTVVISPPLATAIARLDDDQWDTVRQQSLAMYDQAVGKYEYALNDQAVAELRERSLPYWTAQAATGEQEKMILLFVSSFVKANNFLNEDAIKQRKQAARDAI